MKDFPQRKPIAILFDMDGTLVRHIDPRLIEVMEWLDTQAFRISSIFRWIFERKANPAALPDWNEYEKQKKPRRLFHRAMHKLRRKEVDQIVEPSPGVYNFLMACDATSIPVGLSSNGLGAGYGHEVLKTFNFTDTFRATVFCEEIKKPKPDPQGLLLTLHKMEITPQADDVIWYIGDRRKDMKAALKAQEAWGCTVVPIAYTLDAAIQILKEHLSPEHIITSYDALLKKLQDIADISEKKGGASRAN